MAEPRPRTRYLIAPDKFKGTLSAKDAGEAIAVGILRADTTAQIVVLPFPDGGEGTVDAIVHAGGARRRDRVHGPLGEPVEAEWAMRQGVAFIEMSGPSGLKLVEPSVATAWSADTRGTGELIARALEEGATGIVIGAGGSATTDGGYGALSELGIRFLDERGEHISRVDRLADVRALDLAARIPAMDNVQVFVCADVLSPLTGPSGIAAVFGPQKGADTATIAQLEERLRALAGVYATMPHGASAVSEGGAAGGLAAGAVVALGAEIRNDVGLLADILELDSHILNADVVIVGEGSLDEQSRFGKTPVGIARRARALGVPAIAVAGVSTLLPDALCDDGIEAIHTAVEQAGSVPAALADPAWFISLAAQHAVNERFLAALPRGE